MTSRFNSVKYTFNTELNWYFTYYIFIGYLLINWNKYDTNGVKEQMAR